jgi:hypothetical protein
MKEFETPLLNFGRIDHEDLTPKPKRPEPTRDPEELKLRGQREELINSYNQLLNRAKDRQQSAAREGRESSSGRAIQHEGVWTRYSGHADARRSTPIPSDAMESLLQKLLRVSSL